MQGYYGTEESDIVSLWIGIAPSQEQLSDYVAISYDDNIDDDDANSTFMKEFGIFWFDDDFIEAVYRGRDILEVKDAIQNSSYADQIIPQFEEQIGPRFRESINSTVLVYEFRYPGEAYSGPLVGDASSIVKMHFVGVAKYVHR